MRLLLLVPWEETVGSNLLSNPLQQVSPLRMFCAVLLLCLCYVISYPSFIVKSSFLKHLCSLEPHKLHRLQGGKYYSHAISLAAFSSKRVVPLPGFKPAASRTSAVETNTRSRMSTCLENACSNL